MCDHSHCAEEHTCAPVHSCAFEKLDASAAQALAGAGTHPAVCACMRLTMAVILRQRWIQLAPFAAKSGTEALLSLHPLPCCNGLSMHAAGVITGRRFLPITPRRIGLSRSARTIVDDCTLWAVTAQVGGNRCQCAVERGCQAAPDEDGHSRPRKGNEAPRSPEIRRSGVTWEWIAACKRARLKTQSYLPCNGISGTGCCANNRRFMSLCVGSKKSVEDFGLRRKQYESPYLGRVCNDLLSTTQTRLDSRTRSATRIICKA